MPSAGRRCPGGGGTRIAVRRVWIAEKSWTRRLRAGAGALFLTGCREWSNGRWARAAGGPKGGPQSVGVSLARHA
jgi:hypothetical protein